MKAEQYMQTQHQLMVIASLVAEMPLEEFLADIQKADSVGPILNPSLWIAGNEKMQMVKQLAQAALDVKTVTLKHRCAGADPDGSRRNRHG